MRFGSGTRQRWRPDRWWSRPRCSRAPETGTQIAAIAPAPARIRFEIFAPRCVGQGLPSRTEPPGARKRSPYRRRSQRGTAPARPSAAAGQVVQDRKSRFRRARPWTSNDQFPRGHQERLGHKPSEWPREAIRPPARRRPHASVLRRQASHRGFAIEAGKTCKGDEACARESIVPCAAAASNGDPQ